jgi:hypothetical protein
MPKVRLCQHLNRLSKVYNSMETKNIVKVLFGQMNQRQKLCFKQAIVAQTIYYVSQHLPHEDLDEGERSFIELANQWLAQPTTENADRAITATIFDRVDGGVRYFDYSDYFLIPAEAAGAENGDDATRYALIAAGEFRQDEAQQWQKTAALNILADRDPPSLLDKFC